MATDGKKETSGKTDVVVRKTSAGEFINQVRTEARRITWPTRKETITMALFVGAFSFLMSMFFLLVDFGFGQIFRLLLNRS